MKLKIKKFFQDAILPNYQSAGAAGFDFHAHLSEACFIPAGGSLIVGTGIGIEVPNGYELQIRPRSGLAFRHSISLLNGVGTIDSDYRGEIKVVLINYGKNDFMLEPAMRIAQGVVASVKHAEWELVDELSDTARSTGGFGSTGLK